MSALAAINGKYRLDKRIGGGGMAEVFSGTTLGAEGFTRKVAIKRVLPGYSNNPEFAQMFVAEAQLSSQLVHPNIVSVLDFDRDDQRRLFLVMELVEGADLGALSASGRLPYEVIAYISMEVLRGLGHAHDLPLGGDVRGLIHRDVSPQNVLLSWEGDVKVSDFGIAKARDASGATASVLLKGKPAYMSPEQANGEALDCRSDLFSVGVMMWEMLAGRRLFVAEDTRGTLAAVLFGKIPRPRQFSPDVPKDLERVAMKLLERRLSERYPSAESAISDLVECGSSASERGRDSLIALLSARFTRPRRVAENRLPRATSHHGPTARRSRALKWFALAPLIAGMCLATYVVMSRSVREGKEAKSSSAVAHASQVPDAPLVDAPQPHDASSPVDALVYSYFVDTANVPYCVEYVVRLKKLLACLKPDAAYRYLHVDSLKNTQYRLEGHIDYYAEHPREYDLECKAHMDDLPMGLDCADPMYAVAIPGRDYVVVNGVSVVVTKKRVIEPKYTPASCVALIKRFEVLHQCYGHQPDRPDLRDLYPSSIRNLKNKLLGADLATTTTIPTRASLLRSIELSCQQELKTQTAIGCPIEPAPSGKGQSQETPNNPMVVKKVVPPGCIAFREGYERISRCSLLAPELRKAFEDAALAMRESYLVTPSAVKNMNEGCLSGLKTLLEAHPGC